MKLSELLVPEQVVLPLTGRDKWEAIAVLVRAAVRAGALVENAAAEVEAALIERERSMTTGMEHGIAIPHSRHPSVDRLIGTLALAKSPLPFESLDAEPVDVFFLLVSPQDRPGDHLRALEAVVRTMRDEEFVRRLRACQTGDEIWALLERAAPGW